MPHSPISHAFCKAFPYTLPIFAGFWFVGLGYGLYMTISGFSFWYPFFMAMIIFGGSLEFITVSMLLSPFAPLATAVVALMVQARHLFYGISMLEIYKDMGRKKPFLIFWLCDETFAINHTVTPPTGVDRGWFYFFISLLNYLYWVTGSLVGGLMGNILSAFDLSGLEFIMTAMFVVIFTEHMLHEKQKITAAVGFFAAVLSLLLFGADNFMLPAMVLILLGLTLLRAPIAKRGEYE